MKTTIRTYEELKRLVNHFANTASNLIIVGAPGLSKTTIVEEALGDKGRKLDGNVTAFELYKLLYQHRDELIVLDDIDSLYGNKAAIRLLKQACQTTKVKTVSWHSSHHDLSDDGNGIPQEFQTTSRFVIIANEWKSLNQNVSAIEDRGVLISFEPTAQEVHEYVSQWFDDRVVLDFVASILHKVSSVSARIYIISSNLRQAQLPWQEAICATLGISEQTLKLIEVEQSGEAPGNRSKRYQEEAGVSQATYYRHRKKMKAVQERGHESACA